MRAVGWSLSLVMGSALVAGIISGVSGWDSDTVYRTVLCVVIFGLCDKVWGE